MSTMVMYGTMGNGIGANRADTTANGMSTTVTYGETVSGIGANRADTTANGTSTTVTYGETVSGIGAKDITITTATGKTVTTTVTTKTAIKIKESLPDSVPGSVGSATGTSSCAMIRLSQTWAACSRAARSSAMSPRASSDIRRRLGGRSARPSRFRQRALGDLSSKAASP